jgi:hypothetical protein
LSIDEKLPNEPLSRAAATASEAEARLRMNDRYEEIASALPDNFDNLPRLGGFRLHGMDTTESGGRFEEVISEW